MNAQLHRYWIKFKGPSESPLGYGVTAWTEQDAQAILSSEVFDGDALPEFEATLDVDVRILDANHVLPNMENPASRGIWFPRGYAKS